jgi:hypothetical protein
LSRFAAMTLLFLEGLLFVGIYSGIVYFAGLFDVYDVEFIELKFPKIYAAIKLILPRHER